MKATSSHAESAIELRIGRIAQLFNSFDPAPFRERDLDKDAEQHIVASAREVPVGHALRIVVHVPRSEMESPLAPEIEPAIRNYFDHEVSVENSALRELTRDGRRALAVGLSILAASLVSIYLVSTHVPFPNLARLAEDSLIILGWVGVWGPLEILLYDRVPLIRRRRLYRRLASASVEIRCSDAERHR
jgi:hypothetical protein